MGGKLSGGKKGGGKKGGGKKGGGCAAGEVGILLTETLYNIIKSAVDGAGVVAGNRQVCLKPVPAQLLLQATGLALGIGPKKKKGKGKKGKGKKGKDNKNTKNGKKGGK